MSRYKFEGMGAPFPSYEHVLWIVGVEGCDVSSVADPDPGSGAFLTQRSGMGKNQDSDSG